MHTVFLTTFGLCFLMFGTGVSVGVLLGWTMLENNSLSDKPASERDTYTRL